MKVAEGPHTETNASVSAREVAVLHDQYIEIFRSGPRAWNAWRENNSDNIPDLAGVAPTLSERQMGPINGGPINLKSVLLRGASLRFATLSAADLEAADLSDADLTHARLDRADLTAAKLSNALLDHTDFSGANLTKSTWCGASLHFAILSKADLQAADMSGADLTHARLDRANLSTANLTNARLDYADFSGANLSRVNLCGASLEHAKNLTESQLRECTGNASTILPPHLQNFVSWSGVKGQAEIERHDLRPRAMRPADAYVSYIIGHNVHRWRVGVVLIGLALVTTTFIWQRMNEGEPPNTSRAQKWLEPHPSQRRLSSNTAEQALQQSAPETLTDGKPTPEGRHADPKVLPTSNARAELQASDGAQPLTETGPNEQAPKTVEQAQESNSRPVSIDSLAVSSRHAVIPDLPAAAPAAPIPDPQIPLAAEQPAESLAVDTPSALAPKSMVSDLPAEANMTEPLAVNVPEEHLDASSLNYTALPPVTTGLPSINATELRSDAEIVPRPARKPLNQKPLNQKPVTTSVIQKPVTKPPIQKPVTKPVIQREADSKPAPRHRSKDQGLFDKRVRSSITDLLAGGL